MTTDPYDHLVTVLARLPGLGRRTAERMALRLVRDRDGLMSELKGALEEAARELASCELCGSITTRELNPCRLCTDPRREDTLLCVVEDPTDILLIERSGGFHGRYHALHGRLSPMRRQGVGDLRIDRLLQRVKEGAVSEVVLALNTDVESDATASYLHDVLAPTGIQVTRLAFGLPAGSGLAYSDPETLARALKGRQDIP